MIRLVMGLLLARVGLLSLVSMWSFVFLSLPGDSLAAGARSL